MKYKAVVSLLTIISFMVLGTMSPNVVALNDNNPPSPPTIEGPTSGIASTFYVYNITVVDPDDDFMDTMEVDFGDETITVYECGCTQPRWSSGDIIQVTHNWKSSGTYTVRARVADVNGLWGDWGTLEVTMPLVNQPPLITLLTQIMEWLIQFWSSTFFPFLITG